MASSPLYQLNSHDAKRVGEIFAQAILSVILVNAIQLIPQIQFGPYSPLIMAAIVPILETAKRYLQAPADPLPGPTTEVSLPPTV